MTDQLGPEARALLDAARHGISPDAAAVRRVRAGIEVRIAAGGGAAGGAAGAGTGAGVSAKLAVTALAALATLALVATGAWWIARRGGVAAVPPHAEAAGPRGAPVHATRPEAPPPTSDDARIAVEAPVAAGEEPAPSGSSAAKGGARAASPGSPAPPRASTAAPGARAASPGSPVPPRASTPPPGVRAASPGSPVPPVARSASPAPAATPPVASTVRPPPRGAPGRPVASAPAHAAIDLSREVELLDLAMTALRQGDARGALRAVQRHAAETSGRGQLAEDAAAIEVEALCRLRDPAAGARLQAFDARFPGSAQRARLTERCR
ncbi:MAG TPA: hypothetical protein VFT22_04905 [Kofleriaceae bacterium]|nr:hypothetical protein [Kofleriaceae bacterium]